MTDRLTNLIWPRDAGLMLPCNVVIFEKQGKTVVSFIKPKVVMKMIGNAELEQIACTIEKKLKSF